MPVIDTVQLARVTTTVMLMPAQGVSADLCREVQLCISS